MTDQAEVWREVRLFEGYEVSNLGRVRSLLKGTPRILKPHHRKEGYVTVGLYCGRKQITVHVHRIVCEAFHGPAPQPGMHAAHEDGKRGSNRASNLSWKTPASNLADKHRHGTHGAGELHGGHRIDESTVRVVFERRADGDNLKSIALATGLHFTHVADIVARKSWSHVALPSELVERAQRVDGCRKRAA